MPRRPLPPEDTDEWDSLLAFANTGDSEDYSYLDDDEDVTE